jgi:L-aspartate oxidase
MQCDILIIGAGLAGVTTALYLADQFDHIIVVSKSSNKALSNTYQAQGGIVYDGEGDSPELRTKDILYAGAGLCYQPHVDILTQEGPEVVRDLLMNQAHIDFTHSDNGTMDTTGEGAHSVRRIIYSEDRTGQVIMEGLLNQITNHPHITYLENYMALDLITREHHSDDLMAIYKKPECLGAYFFNPSQNRTLKIEAKATVLATGGMGQIYRYTSNTEGSTGDGLSMAYRAGCHIINMEYTQFHPTTLFDKGQERFLISEAVRGEGGRLLNDKDEAFMKKYHPMGDLAPRDVVTRGILEEMMRTDMPYVYLDITHLGQAHIQERFPKIYNACMEAHIYPEKQYIPVVPAYHFSCGGIKVSEWAKTSIARLFAVGECACNGVHGANRLASTSLLECVVYGKRAATYIKEHWDAYDIVESCHLPEWQESKGDEVDIALLLQDWNNLRTTMWNYVGPIRSKHRLRRAISDLRILQENSEDFYRDCRLSQGLIELRNAVSVGLLVSRAAWVNRTSRGCHYRVD